MELCQTLMYNLEEWIFSSVVVEDHPLQLVAMILTSTLLQARVCPPPQLQARMFTVFNLLVVKMILTRVPPPPWPLVLSSLMLTKVCPRCLVSSLAALTQLVYLGMAAPLTSLDSLDHLTSSEPHLAKDLLDHC